MKKAVLFLALVLTSGVSWGQTESQQEIPLIGVGLNLTQFRFTDLFSSEIYLAPSNTIMLEVTPIKYIRLTPSFGIMSQKETQVLGPDQIKKEAKSLNTTYGVGAFGMYQYEKTNIYAGLRYDFSQIKSEYYDSDYMFDPNTGQGYYVYNLITSTYKRNTITPTLGAEYFLGNHFSFGGEFGVRLMSFDFRRTGPGTSYNDEPSSSIATDASAQVRFYF